MDMPFKQHSFQNFQQGGDHKKMQYGVVIPNRYQDVIEPLVDSIHRFIPQPHPRIIIVADGHQNNYGFEKIDYPYPEFVFAKSANLGIKALGDLDVILLNDDCVILEENYFEKLSKLITSYNTIGVLSPLIKGCVGNPYQRWHNRSRYWNDSQRIKVIHDLTVCFPCVYIKRAVFNDVGLLDESFIKYGGEDDEFCARVRRVTSKEYPTGKWRTAVTKDLCIQHGDGSADLHSGWGKSWSTSYARSRKGSK